MGMAAIVLGSVAVFDFVEVGVRGHRAGVVSVALALVVGGLELIAELGECGHPGCGGEGCSGGLVGGDGVSVDGVHGSPWLCWCCRLTRRYTYRLGVG